uniref:Ficolin-2-like n=1 Tax=Phallusia mammillata TaxID=59560 RepID=A0A6F9DDK6_9ASCI|nr:ficolin-2-like [Phallusia mammillata]
MNSPKASGLALTLLFDFIAVLLGQSVTCKTQFSDLKHSITSVICPANCWEENPLLCGNGVYTSGPICLAAMHDQQIENSGGLVQVFRNPGQGAHLYGKQRNGVQTQTCSAGKYSYTFSMTCKTTGDCELPITHVYCLAKCKAASYTYTSGKYFTNSSVCAAAKKRGTISDAGGKVVIYAMKAKAYNGTNTTNTDWFSFDDFDVCSYVNPCANNGTCVDLLADYGCLCPEKYTGRNCETKLPCAPGNQKSALAETLKNLCLQGWTTVQTRFDGSVSFSRPWEDYKTGFGSQSGEFWLGLEKIHVMTQSKSCRVRFDLTNPGKEVKFAEYRIFEIGSEIENYKLNISGYSTSSTLDDNMDYHIGMQFSTYDRDNDIHTTIHCAEHYGGGWWYRNCRYVDLNQSPRACWNPSSFDVAAMSIKCDCHGSNI